MMSYMMSCAYAIICLVYDIFTDSALFQCCPGQFECGPCPRSSNAARFESNAGPARPLRLSVCPGIKIGMQWFIKLLTISSTCVPLRY